MMNILKTKFLLFRRKPAAYIVTTIIICIFTYLMGQGQVTKEPIALFSTLNNEQQSVIMKELKNYRNMISQCMKRMRRLNK